MPLEQRDGFYPHRKKGPNRVIKNPYPGMAALLMSEQSQDPAKAAARDIANIARGTAARGGTTSDSEDKAYGDSFRVETPEEGHVVGGNRRLIAVVVNSHPAAASQEFGGKRTKARRTLGKAGGAVGEYRGTADDA